MMKLVHRRRRIILQGLRIYKRFVRSGRRCRLTLRLLEVHVLTPHIKLVSISVLITVMLKLLVEVVVIHSVGLHVLVSH